MADTFRIYKGTAKVVEGASPLTITGLEPETAVTAGTYQAVRMVDDVESEKVDIPAFTTLAAVIPVTGVTLDQTTLSLAVGETATLTPTVAPTDATDKSYQLTSSDAAIATVTPVQGKVTAVAAGTATITVSTIDGSKTATCEVTVTAAEG